MDHVKSAVDATAIGMSFSAFIGLMQPLAALIASLLSIVWLCIQIRTYLKNRGM